MGHTVTFSNNSYQEMAVDSYMNLMDSYTCAAIVQGGAIPNNEYTYTYSGECGCLLPYILIAMYKCIQYIGGIAWWILPS